ncbi:MAG: DUF4394 domain-containing protein [Thermoleophilaceae bacterium]|nr:DUF4394 domain-containing protein [Thermoleophilaceae bacterium]
MKRRILATLVAALSIGVPAAHAEQLAGVTDDNRLVFFDSGDPRAIDLRPPVAGLQPGELINGFDRRPATNQLYAMTDQNNIYVIDGLANTATLLRTFTPKLAGATFGFDFSAETDRIRVLSDSGQSFRLRATNLASASDGPVRLVGGGRPSMSGAAYSGNRVGSKSSRLYAINDQNDRLYRLTTSNKSGTNFESIGRLGVAIGPRTGFDIASDGLAYGAFQVGTDPSTQIYRVSLVNGAATKLGTLGGGLKLVGLTALGLGAPDTKAPGITVSISASQRSNVLAAKGLRVTLSTTEAGDLDAEAKLRGSQIGEAGEFVESRSSRVLKISFNSLGRAAIRRGSSVRIALRITVKDVAGNTTVVQRIVKARAG